ncbi:MAG: hypothetical protein IT200_04560 [Thermoleophilia bacterium]|nr:hypothetical protein [Thermoleophilia bacterium]
MNVTERSIGSHDLVMWATDETSGMQAAVALHTAQTPALGQLVHDPSGDPTDAILGALRRSERATRRARLLGVPAGGAAAVLAGGAPGPALFTAFGHVLDRLEGRLWVMPGPGCTPADLQVAAAVRDRVAGAAEGADLLPAEARGAVAAARSAWAHGSGNANLAGARGVVLGAGRIAAGAARMLAGQDALVVIADADPARGAALAAEVDGVTATPAAAIASGCDVLMPCADGVRLRAGQVEALRCRVVAGPADGQLADPDVARTLAACGIVWVPEVLAGAGGLLSAAREIGLGDLRGDADSDTTRIASVTSAVLAAADDLDTAAALERVADATPPTPAPDRPLTVRAMRAA